MSTSVCVVGSFMMDLVAYAPRRPRPGETLIGTDFSSAPGGKGFNQAIACLRQGAPTLFVGAIGDDALGAAAQAFAAAEGLPCRWQRRSDVPSAAAGVLVDDAGANVVVVNLAANERLDPAHVAAQAGAFAAAKILLLQLESNLAAVAAALDLGARHGLLRVLNPAPMHADLDAALLTRCDVVTPNETEFALLCGGRTEPLEGLMREWVESQRQTLIVTLGSEGARAATADGEMISVPAHPVVPIDTVGAGDTFCGYLAAGLDAGMPLEAAMRRAAVAASLACTKPGAQPAVPYDAEVAAALSSGSI